MDEASIIRYLASMLDDGGIEPKVTRMGNLHLRLEDGKEFIIAVTEV